MAQILTPAKCALNMFYDIEVIPNPASKSFVDYGLDDILTAVSTVLQSVMIKMKCVKFQLICDATFQVNRKYCY